MVMKCVAFVLDVLALISVTRIVLDALALISVTRIGCPNIHTCHSHWMP